MGKLRILYVEDEPTTASGHVLLMRQKLQHDVDCAESVEQAERMLRETKYQAVLLDIMLMGPCGSLGAETDWRRAGYLLLNEIHGGRYDSNEKGTSRRVPVLVVTAQLNEDVRKEVISLLEQHNSVQGRAEEFYLEKPANFDEFQDALARLAILVTKVESAPSKAQPKTAIDETGS